MAPRPARDDDDRHCGDQCCLVDCSLLTIRVSAATTFHLVRHVGAIAVVKVDQTIAVLVSPVAALAVGRRPRGLRDAGE